jgi:hemoglobin/transferrin/lactoferrin receptor protein
LQGAAASCWAAGYFWELNTGKIIHMNHILRLKGTYLLFIAFIFTEALHSHAESATASGIESTNAIEELPPVFVTATRTAEETANVPYTVNTVTTSNLQVQQPRTLPEALKETPSVMVQKTAHGQGSPYIRGFTGFRTLMLIDGVRLNNSTFREGPNQYWNTVDIFSVDQLEVVKGPSSTMYGSDAIGGTVNAITVRRQQFEEGLDAGGRLLYRGATAEDSHTVRAEAEGNIDDDLGLLVGSTWKDYGELDGGEDIGRQPKTDYDELDWDAKLEYKIQPDTSLVLAHQTVDQEDAWRTHRTIYGIPWEGTTIGTDRMLSLDQHRDLTYLQLHAVNIQSFVEEFHVNVSHHFQQDREHRIRSNSLGQRQGVDVHTLGTFIQLQSPSSVGTWVYGVEYYRDWVDSFSDQYSTNDILTGSDVQGPVADDSTYDLLGAFVEDRIPVGERVELTLGGRFNYAAADAGKVRDPISGTQTNLSDHWTALVGSGRVLWHMDEEERWQTFGGISQGFRAPNLSDLTRLDIAASGELETAAPNLDPEHYVSYEIGVRANWHRGFGQLAYYYTAIDGMIVRTPTGNTVNGAAEVTKRNAGDGYIHGIELNAEQSLHPWWTVRAAFSWMDGEVDGYPTSAPVQVREPVSRLMPTTLQLGLRTGPPAGRWWAEFLWTLVDEQDRLSAADQRDTQRIPPGGTPGYSVYTFRTGWQPTRDLVLTAAVENLSNEDYRVHGSGLNEPGLSFVFSATLRL